MRRLVLAAVTSALAVSTLTAGCAANNSSPVSAAAAKALRPLVQQLRQAAHGHSIFAVQRAEQALVDEVQSLQDSSDLNPKRAQNIDNAAVLLLNDFRHHNQPTAPPTSATPSITPTSESPSPTPTVTVTAPPTDTASASPTESTTPTPTKTKTGNPLFPH